MKNLWDFPAAVRDELRRLVDLECAALLRKDDATVITARLLWAETYLRHGGVHSPALPHLTAAVDDTLRPVVHPRDRWKQEKRARPLVAVVARKEITWIDRSGAAHSYYRETLACGHVNQFAIFWEDEKPARRRRCQECGRLLVQQMQHTGGIGQTQPLLHTTSREAKPIRGRLLLPANVVMMPARKFDPDTVNLGDYLHHA